MRFNLQTLVDTRTPEQRRAYRTIEQQRATALLSIKPTLGILDLMAAIRQRWPDRIIQRAAIKKLVKRLRELRGE